MSQCGVRMLLTSLTEVNSRILALTRSHDALALPPSKPNGTALNLHLVSWLCHQCLDITASLLANTGNFVIIFQYWYFFFSKYESPHSWRGGGTTCDGSLRCTMENGQEGWGVGRVGAGGGSKSVYGPPDLNQHWIISIYWLFYAECGGFGFICIALQEIWIHTFDCRVARKYPSPVNKVLSEKTTTQQQCAKQKLGPLQAAKVELQGSEGPLTGLLWGVLGSQRPRQPGPKNHVS